MACTAGAVLLPVCSHGNILRRHDEAGVFIVGVGDGDIIRSPTVEAVTRFRACVDVDGNAHGVVTCTGRVGVNAVQRHGVGICFPLRPVFLITRFGIADFRNRVAR